MELLSFRKPYEMLPPVLEKQMLTHIFAYKHGTFLSDIGLDDIDSVLAPSWPGLYILPLGHTLRVLTWPAGGSGAV
jgi:hypothetical protein